MAQATPLSRRRLLQLTGLGGTVLAGAALGGCWSAAPAGQLWSARGELPQAWRKALPRAWSARLFETPQALLEASSEPQTLPALLSLGDGWAGQLRRERLLPFEAAAMLEQLAPIAAAPSRLFGPADAAPLAFPWAFGTWVVLLRNRADLLRRRDEGWNLLLDPSLRRRLVLPGSPRLLIELALRQLELPSGDPAALASPRLPSQLRALHGQALSLDDRGGLNLLLSGEADAAVVTSQRAIPLLQRDPRLSAFLPASGSPLWWQLLLRLAPDPPTAAPPPPLEWLRDGLQQPLLDRLLAAGWLPPLPAATLEPVLARWPKRLSTLLLPPAAVLARCNSLPPFSPAERERWQQLWDQALAAA